METYIRQNCWEESEVFSYPDMVKSFQPVVVIGPTKIGILLEPVKVLADLKNSAPKLFIF